MTLSDSPQLKYQIRSGSRILSEAFTSRVAADLAFNQLSEDENFVMTTYYMQKSKWDYVSNRYYEEYKKPKSVNQLLNIRDRAMRSMLDIINVTL